MTNEIIEVVENPYFKLAKEIMLEELESLIQTVYILTVMTEDKEDEIDYINDNSVGHDEELNQVLHLISDVKFQLDLHFIQTPVEIQNYFDDYIRNSEHHYRLRTVMNLTNVLHARLGKENWKGLVTTLHETLCLHANVEPDKTTYDDLITLNLWSKNLAILQNNPWLVTVCLINLLPAINIIKYLTPETYFNSETTT